MSNFDATTIDGERFRTKRALKQALQATPDNVLLTCTDLLGANVGTSYRANELPPDLIAYIAGPDPHTARTWFANVRQRGERIVVQ